MVLRDRQKSILESAIFEYIKTAKPVASRDLLKKKSIKVSAATIRSELQHLDELGLLEQPHTSAGRIPTDQGYRFFVDNLINGFELNKDEEKLIHNLFAVSKTGEFIKELCRTLAHLSRTFSWVGIPGENIFYESGFSEILNEPEFRESENIKTFARFADLLDEEIKDLFLGLETKDEKIFIGSENPLKEARAYSMILSSWEHPNGFRGFVGMIGPRRMNYAKQRAIVKKIKHGG